MIKIKSVAIKCSLDNNVVIVEMKAVIFFLFYILFTHACTYFIRHSVDLHVVSSSN